MNIVQSVKNELLRRNKIYIEKYENFDFWEQHIKYVVKEALKLAEELNADKEIVELAALLHDIALVTNVGTKHDHHINGANIAKEILNELKYPPEKAKRVIDCILNHRSSKNAQNIEELCLCDADILSHFDNIPMLFRRVYKHENIDSIDEANNWIMNQFKKDYNDLSDRTKLLFQNKYNNIITILFGNL